MLLPLVIVVLLSGGLYVVVHRSREHLVRKPQELRAYLIGYAVCVGLVLVWVSGHFLGFGSYGSPALAETDERYLQHDGYWHAAPVREDTPHFLLRGLATDSTLQHHALAASEYLELKPLVGDSAGEPHVAVWRFRFQAHTRPLRVDDRCINLPPEWWFKPGDTLKVFEVPSDSTAPTRFFMLRWVEGETWYGKRTNTFSYSAGERQEGQLVYKHRDVVLSERVYRETRNLGVMMRLAPREFREQVTHIPAVWADVFDGITWIRHTRKALDTPMGVFLEARLFDTERGAGRTVVALYKNGQRLQRPAPGEQIRDLAPGARVEYGFGYGPTLGLAPLAERLEYEAGAQQLIASIRFKNPERWSLPPEAGAEFMLTSSTAYLPIDGYSFPTTARAHPFYAKGRFAQGQLWINEGLPDAEGPAGRLVALGQSLRLGDSEQGVVLSYRAVQVAPPRWRALGELPFLSGHGTWVVILLVVLTAGFALLLWKEQRTYARVKPELAFTLLWGLVLTILVVRLVVSYRVALLPPGDATEDELRNVFGRTFSVSLWALAFIPTGMLAGRWLLHSRWGWKRMQGWLGALAEAAGQGGGQPATERSPDTHAPRWASLKKVLASLAFNKERARLCVLFMRRGSASLGKGLVRFGRRYWMLLLPTGWVLMAAVKGKVWGDGEDLVLRVSMVLHLLIVIGLGPVLLRMLAQPRPRRTWDLVGIIGAVTVALVLYIVLVGDKGAVLYLLSLFYFFLFLVYWDGRSYASHATHSGLRRLLGSRRSRWRLGLGLVLLVAPPLLLYVAPHLPLGRLPLVSAVVSPEGNMFYRFASLNDSEESVMLETRVGDGVHLDQVLNNSLQHWEMMLYATEGSRQPRGFGNVPISDQGMTYPTTVTDCAFSIYLLSEHGPWTSFLFLVLYAGLCGACIMGGWHVGRTNRTRSLLLALIGAFYGVHALYMAAANLGLVIFTGQNIPLLGLYSPSDLVHNAVLLALASMLLQVNQRILPLTATEGMRGQSIMLWLERSFLGLVGGATLLLLFRMVTLEKQYTADHTFSDSFFAEISQRLWKYDAATGELEPDDFKGPLREVEQWYQEQFERRPTKYDPSGGLYYLEQEVRGRDTTDAVRVNTHYFTMRSRFKQAPRWQGIVYARGEHVEPTLTTLGQEFRIRLGTDVEYESVVLAEHPPVTAQGGVVILDRFERRICELGRAGERLYLQPAGNTWEIYVEGRSATEQDTTWLEPLDVIVLRHRATGERQDLLYLGATLPVLSATQWRNGRLQHVYPEGKALPSVYTLVQAADYAVMLAQEQGRPDRLPETLTLSLDVELQRALQAVLATHARTHRALTYRDEDPLTGRLLALAVLDAYSGEVLALPAWPQPDPGAPDFDERVRAAPPAQQVRLLRNHNLGRHVIGSTIKPILFGAVASQFWTDDPETRFDLSQVAFISRPTQDRVQLATLPPEDDPVQPHTELAGILLESMWDSDYGNFNTVRINADTFLIDSRNYYAAMTGMLGMVQDRTERARVMVSAPISQADLLLAGRPFRLDLRLASAPSFTTPGPNLPPRLLNGHANSLFYKGLIDGFDAVVVLSEARAAGDSTMLRQSMQAFLPSFARTQAPSRNLYLDELVPEPVVFEPHRMEGYVRAELISMFLGGGSNLWSNVGMAEAAARLATGTKVRATLEARRDSLEFPLMSAPLNLADWRTAHLIEPLRRAGISGTAATIQRRFRERNPTAAQRYRVLYKTGTLQEGDQASLRSELLLFVLGEWNAERQAFVPGRTLSCYLYMQRSRSEKGPYQRHDLAPLLLDVLAQYLDRLRVEG